MKIILTFASLLLSIMSVGQNLIPNGDFETFTNCPTVEGFLNYAAPWENFASLSPDYYNVCANGSTVGVPGNITGYQNPLSGNGYAGVFASQILSAPNVREYVGVQLVEPLQEGITYALQFNVSLANISNYGVTTFGAYFSEGSSLPLDGFIVDVTPQIVNEGDALTDTLNWMSISGTYTALGNEQYITIGNFEDDENCGIQNVLGGSYNASYYYIDDVSLSSVTSIQELSNSIQVYPNPFKEFFNISSSDNKQYEIVLYDLTGRTILKKEFVNSSTVSTSEFADGIYYYELLNDQGIVKKGKLVKK